MIKNITLINTISSVILQFVTLINGFIIPKLILNYFGSEVNGLVSSIVQFLGYIYLVEGGITGVIMSGLYKPLYEKNDKKISSIIETSDKFYHQISLVFIIYTIILAVVYPIFTKTTFSFIYVSSLILILSISLLIQYNYSISLKTLLNADKKVYIVSITQIIILIFNIVLAYISVKIYPSIHLLKLLSGLVYILQPIIYKKIVKKHYNLISNVEEDKNLLKNRWSGFAINIAAFIHFNTDILILNIMTNLKVVSVYSVYAMIVAGLRQIISAISSAIYPSIGHLYVKGNDEELNKKFDLYELIMFFIIYLLFSVAILLITPFVLIYTSNITDVNYNIPILGIVLLISEMIYLIKTPHINLAYSANKFKEMEIPSYIEAILNIVISLVLVKYCGVIGVALGTLCAMSFRTIYQIVFLKKYILNRPCKKFWNKVIIFTLGQAIGMYICKKIISFSKITVLNWIIYGGIYTMIFLIIFIIITYIFYKKEINFLKNK